MHYHLAPPRCSPCPECNRQGGWVSEFISRYYAPEWIDCPNPPCQSGNIWRPTTFKQTRRVWVCRPKFLGAA